MAKVLVIIGAGIEQIKAYEIAKSMGLKVVGTDRALDAPAFEYSDSALIASTRDHGETLRAVKSYFNENKEDEIAGVMTIANDVPMTVATVAEHFKLPGISIDSSIIASDKFLMKESFRSENVKTSKFTEVSCHVEIVEVAEKWGWPLVIKPVDGRGARGVLLIDKDSDHIWAYNESLDSSGVERVMVESFLSGTQISTESMMIDSKCYTPAYSDRNYSHLDAFAPYIIEDGGTMPALLTDEEREAINNLVERGALAMGITDGIVKGDIVMTEEGPAIIELAARLSGGYFATDQIPLSTGVDLVSAAIKYAVGEPVEPEDLKPRYERGAAIRFFFPPEGVISEIKGVSELSSMPGVKKSAVYRSEGERQPQIKTHPDRGGFVIADGEDRAEALRKVEAAIASVVFTVKT